MRRNYSIQPSLACLLAFFVFPGYSRGAEGPEVSAELSKTLAAEGKVVVCVQLKDPALEGDSLNVRCGKYARCQGLFLESMPPGGWRLRYRYRFSPVVVLELLKPSVLDRLRQAPGVERAEPDLEGGGGMLQSRQLTGTNRVHFLGIEGDGTVAAILDTGIDDGNENFDGAIIHQYHFTSAGNEVGEGAPDGNGHGSHVAGILASRGLSAPHGMAPAASLVVVKVLDDDNRGFVSDWARGVEHVIELHDADNGIRVDVINMSLQTDSEYVGSCDGARGAFSMACGAARSRGISVLACGGNYGSTTMLTLPGCFSTTTTIGSLMDTLPLRLSTFTSRTEDLVFLAPGQPILSVGLNGGMRTRAGCSMAVPHVAGLYCLLRQVDPAISPAGLDDLVSETGVEVFDEGTGLSFPLINSEAAVARHTGNDCNGNGIGDDIDVGRGGGSEDCNENGLPDECDIRAGTSRDADGNGIPDECFFAPVFHRGDTNDDGFVDLADGVTVFLFLFLADTSIYCLDSADIDNNERVEITDGIRILVYLFAGGEPPDYPGVPPTDCGPDIDEPGPGLPGSLGCESYTSCQ